MSSVRTIAVVTGTRAEYGILKPLLKKIKAARGLRLQLLVTGMHLLPRYGYTADEIKRDGFVVDATVPMYRGRQTKANYYTNAMALGIKNFSTIFSKEKPDILVVLGDRPEPLAATLAAAFFKIPIAHIQAGDRTDSRDIDESIRHAITRFAHLSFPATAKAKARLIKSGEEGFRVYNIGALGVDSILAEPRVPKENIFKRYGLNSREPLVVCMFHPIHLRPERAGRDMREILEALRAKKIQTVVIFPNNDAGNGDIIKQIEKYRMVTRLKFFPSLPHGDYINLLRHSAVFLGNSSSGIIETPTLKISFVNIGDRQKSRERAGNVVDAAPNRKSITRALEKALYDRTFLKRVKNCANPYGRGEASARLVKLLATIKINQRLLEKRITY